MISLHKRKVLSIVLVSIGIMVVVVGILVGWWELDAILVVISAVVIGGIPTVLVWGFKKPVEQASQTQTVARELIDHGNNIIFGYKNFEYERVRVAGSTWEEYLSGFGYRKELLQHLVSGYGEVYALLNKTIESEKSYREKYNSIITKAAQRVREEAQKLSIPENPIMNQQPEFDEESIVSHIVEEIQFDTWTGFSSARDSTHARVVRSNNRLFRTNAFDTRLLDSLVLKLNDIPRSPEISDDISKCRSMRIIRDNNRADFNNEFQDLRRGIELKTKRLMGACSHCVDLHDPKDIPKLQSLISQVQ